MMHGCYFLFNQLTTFASVFASVYLFTSTGHDDLPAQTLWISAGSIFAAWALTYLSLVLMVKPEWRSSFWSTRTTLDEARTTFYECETEEEKMGIFGLHRSKWESFRDEVRDFTHANWARWKEEQPAWFTEELIQRVPDEFIPVTELVSLNAAQGGKRRRSSMGLVDSVRVSTRESARASARRASFRGNE
jgi:hypothetical protein